MLQRFLQNISVDAQGATSSGWCPYPLFADETASLSSMSCHYSVLAPGRTPHPPHIHTEEELLVILDGDAEVALASDPSDQTPRISPLTVGQFAYYPSPQHHTIRNVSERNVTYLMFKWSNRERQPERHYPDETDGLFPCRMFDVRPEMEVEHECDFAPVVIFEGKTMWLKKLHAHLTRLRPGGGYEPHADPYDVAIVLLQGEIEIDGRRLKDRAVAYFGAGEVHGMHNPGVTTATYLVFEYHQS
jgi:uncharacterized cupin superfamily protein